MLRSAHISLGCAAALAFVISGCRRKPEIIPTERVLVAKTTVAPAFTSATADILASRSVYWGEVHSVRHSFPDVSWQGLFEGWPAQRAGLVETSLAGAEPSRFVFQEDLLDADVPTTPWLCSRIGEHLASCADMLRRTVAAPRVLVAYQTCWQPDCLLAELNDGAVTVTTIPGLSEVRVVTFGGRPAVLAWSHFRRSADWMGSSLVVLLLSPPLARAGEIPLSEIDARDPSKVLYALGDVQILDDGLRVRGRRSFRTRESNVEVSGTDIDERWVFGTDGNLAKR